MRLIIEARPSLLPTERIECLAITERDFLSLG